TQSQPPKFMLVFIPMFGLSAEHDLIIQCVRRAFGQTTTSSSEEDINWDRFAELTEAQGLAPLVHSALASLGVNAPEYVKGRLRNAHALSMLRTRAALEPNLALVLVVLGSRGLNP